MRSSAISPSILSCCLLISYRYCDLSWTTFSQIGKDVLESIDRHLLHDVEMNVLIPSGQWRGMYSYLRDSGGECTHTFVTVEGNV